MANTTNLLNQIQQCTKCGLCDNQKPLLDDKIQADIMWVGLSAVKVESTKDDSPLSIKTNTGKLISEIENSTQDVEFYKTNLVKCLPIKDEKIRYPKQDEMKSCFYNLTKEIKAFKPKIVLLLGKQVADFITKDKSLKFSNEFKYESHKDGEITYIPVHHPSFILVYKRKELKSYVRSISRIINDHR